MSYSDYREALEISTKDPSFRSLVMALIRKADTDNTAKIVREWPAIYEEFCSRYHAPGGMFDDEYDIQPADLTKEERHGP